MHNTLNPLDGPSTIPKTKLPDNLKLTDEEVEELCGLEYCTYPPSEFTVDNEKEFLNSELAEHFSFASTTNIGIHYFCLENGNEALKFLASNENISEDIASLIFDKLESLKASMPMVTSYYSLASNPVVYSNTLVFMKIFQRLCDRFNGSFVRSYTWLTPRMNIDVVMFLMSFIKEDDIETQQAWGVIADSRKDEVLAWVEKDNPDLIKMPLSWILRAYGFFVDLNHV